LRWGGFVRGSQIAKAITPVHLRSGLIAGTRLGLPAMRSLSFLESELSSFRLQWGPGGSVGYELASQQPTVHTESDLDLIILASQPFDREFAGELLELLHACPGKVDCRIETPRCGFSLEEYFRSGTQPFLVRTPTGSLLSNAPWTLASSGDEK
jgi:phosphoribosyl-dephospho-CoA transferase